MAAAIIVIVGCRLTDEPMDHRLKIGASNHLKDRSDVGNRSKFYLRVKYTDVCCFTTVTINGFPVRRLGGGRIRQNPVLRIRLQSGLVRGENTVRVQVEPTTLRHGDALWFPTVRLHGQVTGDYHGEDPIPGAAIPEAAVDSVYAEWKKRAEAAWARFLRSEAAWLEANPDRGWEITWRSGGALDSMWAWSRDNPVIVSTTFHNEQGPDFAHIFRDAPVLQDTARVLSFALHIRDLFQERDPERIYRAHRPRFEAIDFSPDEARDVIATNWLDYEWHLDFDADDLEVVQWSEGRVWEVYRTDEVAERLRKKALLLSGKERLETWHRVYIAEIGGQLQVVR